VLVSPLHSTPSVVELWCLTVAPPPLLLALCCGHPETCTAECLPFIKRCPGSSPTFVLGDPLRTPVVECSGHGTCEREGDCREGDACSAVCSCDTGYQGSGCGLTDEAMDNARTLRGILVGALVRVSKGGGV
jgi:hypothetical protein